MVSNAKEHPILFRGEMVRQILDGKKTQTRRLMAPQPEHRQIHEHRGKVVYDGEHRMWCWENTVVDNLVDFPGNEDRMELAAAQPYKVGDLLWVRESFQTMDSIHGPVPKYQADYRWDGSDWVLIDDEDFYSDGPWRPSIHMPRWASRITLRVTDVRVERVQEISQEDAAAEGMIGRDYCPSPELCQGPGECMFDSDYYFSLLWDSINAKPKPVYKRVAVRRVIDHYVSYPWKDIQETREHRGKPWDVHGNPWVVAYTFQVLGDDR